MKQVFVGWLLLILLAGCKEKYLLPVTTPDTGYLVVEGIINPGPGDSYIELSRTNKLSATGEMVETGAAVRVEGQDNSSFTLLETDTGRYTAMLNLNSAQLYRLRIKTLDGKEYLSDFAVVKAVPAIDSISWQKEGDGIWLQMNTHDPQNETRYYKWDYKETWEFHSAYTSVLKYGSTVGPSGREIYWIGYRDSVRFSQDTTIFRCWKSAQSSNILLSSSVKLASDIIYRFPLLYVPAGDKRISELYSIYVRQYALTKEAYEFLEKMKKNTEENGSIFDPQPSQLKGNIGCVTDPDEPVIGYFSISTVSEKRLFIKNEQLPFWNYKSGCLQGRVRNNSDSIDVAQGAGLMPTEVLATFGTEIIYFGVSTKDCVDCTRTGTNVKPTFWP